MSEKSDHVSCVVVELSRLKSILGLLHPTVNSPLHTSHKHPVCPSMSIQSVVQTLRAIYFWFCQAFDYLKSIYSTDSQFVIMLVWLVVDGKSIMPLLLLLFKIMQALAFFIFGLPLACCCFLEED